MKSFQNKLDDLGFMEMMETWGSQLWRVTENIGGLNGDIASSKLR